MPKKQTINVIIHSGDNPEKGRASIREKLTAWYIELIRQRFLDSGLTTEEKCAVLATLGREWKRKEKEERSAV